MTKTIYNFRDTYFNLYDEDFIESKSSSDNLDEYMDDINSDIGLQTWE